MEDTIRILRKTEPNVCGGTDATLDESAPKTVRSEEMTLFRADSALGFVSKPGEEPLESVSAFAAPAEGGTFLFLQKTADRWSEAESGWALIKGDPFPALVRLVREQDLAKNNGYHSVTHGLPENFGGSVSVSYASGEHIGFSDNQSPVFSRETGLAIVRLFEDAMKGERAALPDLSDLAAIRFEEKEKEGGGFTRAELTLLPDGTGINKRACRYDDPQIFESEKPVDAETVSAIRRTAGAYGMLAWCGLPGKLHPIETEKSLTFVFRDGAERTVMNGRTLPDQLQGGFFKIELELTVKN